MIATRPTGRWLLGHDRRIVAESHPPVEVATLATSSVAGLAGITVLWWWGLPALATVALLVLAATASACFHFPLDHVAVGPTWVANGPVHRPRLVEAADVRSIEMPDLVDLGLPVLKLVAPTGLVRVDVPTLERHRPLAAALLHVVGLAIVAGADLDREAARTISDLRRHHAP